MHYLVYSITEYNLCLNSIFFRILTQQLAIFFLNLFFSWAGDIFSIFRLMDSSHYLLQIFWMNKTPGYSLIILYKYLIWISLTDIIKTNIKKIKILFFWVCILFKSFDTAPRNISLYKTSFYTLHLAFCIPPQWIHTHDYHALHHAIVRYCRLSNWSWIYLCEV